jgi:putative DNA primase/helicase
MTVNDELDNVGMARDETPSFSEAIMNALKTLGYTFRLNSAADTVEVNGKPLSDALAATIRTDFRNLQQKGISMAAMEDAYTAAALANSYHPVRDYLTSLEWDGKNHIGALAKCCTSTDDPVTYEDGDTRPLHGVYLWRWLIGAVQKAYTGKQNPMLVFDGPQGIGKSQFVRWLCRSIPAYFYEGPINTADKDNDVRAITTFVWEVAELDATTRKADVSALKYFISREHVRVRKAYGRHEVDKPALASFFGTVNNTTGFLADETGSRRFYITRITAIDWRYATQINVDQVWAQARALWEQGESPYLTPDEQRAQVAMNAQYEVESTLNDYIDMYFQITKNDEHHMSAGEIIQFLSDKGVKLSGSERVQMTELARVLRSKGLDRVHTRDGKRWAGILEKL